MRLKIGRFFPNSDLDFSSTPETIEHGAARLRFHEAGSAWNKTRGYVHSAADFFGRGGGGARFRDAMGSHQPLRAAGQGQKPEHS